MTSEFKSLFTRRKSVGLKMTESLLYPADEVSRLEIGKVNEIFTKCPSSGLNSD